MPSHHTSDAKHHPSNIPVDLKSGNNEIAISSDPTNHHSPANITPTGLSGLRIPGDSFNSTDTDNRQIKNPLSTKTNAPACNMQALCSSSTFANVKTKSRKKRSAELLTVGASHTRK